MDAKSPKISAVLVKVKMYQLKINLKKIQKIAETADPIKMERLFIFIVGIKANPKLKMMNKIKNGVR